jgi:ureidoglycolate lyase
MPAEARSIRPQALTSAAFAPFGQALLIPPADLGRTINGGSCQRFDGLLALDVQAEGGQPCVAIYCSAGQPAGQPCGLSLLERHQLGSQSFVPLAQSRLLMVVAPALSGDPERPDVAGLQAFWIEPGQGVTLSPGCWHHPMLAIGAAQVLVIERCAEQTDCELYELPAGCSVAI